ncbi:MAG: chromate transporter [Sulfobacillus acidophilus]|uniref:Chromate transporter n=1 Tax=Sulfobacillus acidophilus TaxID=53633 RepID=A0A2T2WIY0_9FIRM|nr:MAG: chromate transporter [Sulfobacillus acidophilus]
MGLLALLFFNFIVVGALGFGGGFGMIPLLKAVTLSHHWLSLTAFDQAIAMGQITPGPVAISATFIGERVAGPLGAVAATLGVFIPSQIVMVVISHWYHRLRAIQSVQHVMNVTLAAVVGLIAGVTLTLGISLVHGFVDGVMAFAIAFVALRFKRIPYWAFILVAGTIGAFWLRA